MPTATPFNNLITFSRGSNATVTGSNGLIQWAPSNFLTFSEQFDNAAWSKIATTVTANTSVAPDGTATADTLVGDGTSAAHQVRLSVVASGAFQHVLSVYLKQGTERYGYLYTLGRNATDDKSDFCFFDLQTGTITQTNASGAGATISAVGNGWYRVTMPTGNYPSSINIEARIGITNTLNQQTSTASGNFLVWGAQLELGSTATTYNSTTVKNLLGFSEAFDNAAWTKTDVSIVTGAQANPVNGLFNAQKLMENTANNLHRVFLGASVSSGVPYVYSTYVKAAERSRIQLTSSAGVSLDAIFDLSNGTVVTAASGTASIVSVGSGWYRCSVLNTAASSTSTNLQIRLIQSGTVNTYTGDGNSGVYIYGAQLSDSASLDPYVPTPGAAPSSTAFYGPRFDYDPVTLQPRGLLVEEQRTNLTLQSEAITSSPWTFYNGANGTAITAITSPSGAANGIGLNDTSASGYYGVTQTVNISTTTTYTFTTYVKQGTSTAGFSVWLIGNNSNTYYQNTIAWTGGVPTAAGWTATNVGNGWYRIAYTFASLTSTNVAIYLLPCPTVLADTGTSYFWGAQLEAGAFATSYIPTVASTVTRSADVATISGQNFGQWYSQPQGSFVAEFRPTIAGSYTVYAATDGTTNNRVQGPASDVAQFLVVTGGATQALLDGGTIPPAAVSKIASAYAANDFALTLNAGAVATDTTGTPPVVDRFSVASLIGNQEFLNGHIRNIRFIPARAADFQLQGLST